MKVKLLLYLSVLSMVFCCTPEPTYSIRFCESLQDDQCQQDTNSFALGKRVYVNLAAQRGFETNKITGAVYKITEKGKYKMGSKDFEIDKGEKMIVQDIPFDEFGLEALGNFEVEFTNENGQPIAVGQLEIVQP